MHLEDAKPIRSDTILLLNMTHIARIIIYLGLSAAWWISLFAWTPSSPYYIDGHYVPVMQLPPLLPAIVITLVLLLRIILAYRLWFFGSRVLGISIGTDFAEIMIAASFLMMNRIELYGFNMISCSFLAIGLMSVTSFIISILPKTQRLYNIRKGTISDVPTSSDSYVFYLGVFLLVINALISFLTSMYVCTSQWPYATIWTFPVLPWAVILQILFLFNSIAAVGIIRKYHWSYHYAMFVSVISALYGFYTVITSVSVILVLMTRSFRSEFLSVNNKFRLASSGRT